jgi:hypothetical protein
MTKDWEFEPHEILLRKEIKEGVLGRGSLAESAEMRD